MFRGVLRQDAPARGEPDFRQARFWVIAKIAQSLIGALGNQDLPPRNE